MKTPKEKARAAVLRASRAHRKAEARANAAQHAERIKSEGLRGKQAVYLEACGWERVSIYRGSSHWHRMFESYFKRPKGSTYHSLRAAIERQRVADNKQRKAKRA